ncbi:dTDP-4-dehydrorhamnose 3,5-epimerase [Salinisphaera sp.]|uniref:dTDP-4-dehydrorhamnose 3,5-epimerase n=1 Tax=Salinisphaera sp. TaxID=1914330 RepID=UPI000C356B44|nr:dTDP-4-dehydrorhamnose 3,5-epimerase [Salinisphaera sp.]MAS10501.1 dTDP-4-dehydrorhamnose 3,5-epimerase [Salinisphaera sp.]|tara:strand:- start:9671 stop:10219 length:549 start_codon:yes stop_codon:yes gene_type:complete
MKVFDLALPEVKLIEPDVFGDSRGYFMETYQARRYEWLGDDDVFVQDNLSFSRRGVLRGLHYQHPNAQGKLVQVLNGEIYDVAVDIRQGSPSFGRWVGEYLDAKRHRQLWVPPGFAHGFCVLSETALFAYKCTAFYAPESERALRWDDTDIAVAWPIEPSDISDKDRSAPYLNDVPAGQLPR